ncbi:MAG: hypothetical protein C5S52_01505 [ANME-2 cluster archaeon]|nr:hypothetical protein [ANME-2 cluster archaeon]
MNKKIILPFVAILVLAVAMVGAASADEVTTVDTVEVRGNVANATQANAGINWTAQDFAAFWYDLDDDLSTETLELIGGTSGTDRNIADDQLVYTTYPEHQLYELYADKGLVVEGDDTNLSIGYYIEGWLAEEYVAVNGRADELVKLLVEFEGDDKKTLSTGEAWDLGNGFALIAQQIDLEGDKVWFSLEKDGKELDSEVVTTGADITNESVYTYTEDIGSEDDVPVFSCLVDAVFRGTDSNIVQVRYVFLVDNVVLEIDSDDKFGAMEATAGPTMITLRNEDAIDLGKDTTEHIMGNMYFKTADDTALRFYPMVEYTIGEGAAGEAEEEVETPTDANETADVNVTPTAVVTPTPEEAASPVVTATAEDTTADAEETATPKTPGFEAVFAIAGLLAVAYLVLRQRE